MSVGAGIAAAAGIGAVGSLLAADEQSDAARKASRTQLDMYNQTRADLEPYRNIGYAALDVLGGMFIPGFGSSADRGRISDLETERKSLLSQGGGGRTGGLPFDWGGGLPINMDSESGLSPTQHDKYAQRQFETRLSRAGGRDNTARLAQIDAELQELRSSGETEAPDYSAFYKSPGYEFRFDEGQRAVSRGASARGRRLGGAHERELIRYGQGVASEEFNSYANRLASLAGLGQTSTAQTGKFGAQAAGQAGGYQLAAGTARASGYAGAANAAQGGISNALFYYGLQNQGGSQWNPWGS